MAANSRSKARNAQYGNDTRMQHMPKGSSALPYWRSKASIWLSPQSFTFSLFLRCFGPNCLARLAALVWNRLGDRVPAIPHLGPPHPRQVLVAFSGAQRRPCPRDHWSLQPGSTPIVYRSNGILLRLDAGFSQLAPPLLIPLHNDLHPHADPQRGENFARTVWRRVPGLYETNWTVAAPSSS